MSRVDVFGVCLMVVAACTALLGADPRLMLALDAAIAAPLLLHWITNK